MLGHNNAVLSDPYHNGMIIFLLIQFQKSLPDRKKAKKKKTQSSRCTKHYKDLCKMIYLFSGV